MAEDKPIPQLRRFRDDESSTLHYVLTGNAWYLQTNTGIITRLRPDDDVNCTVKDNADG